MGPIELIAQTAHKTTKGPFVRHPEHPLPPSLSLREVIQNLRVVCCPLQTADTQTQFFRCGSCIPDLCGLAPAPAVPLSGFPNSCPPPPPAARLTRLTCPRALLWLQIGSN